MTDTETLDKLYLEWSQITKAQTSRDILAANRADRIMNIIVNSTAPKTEELARIYNAAKEIYESSLQKSHYWLVGEIDEVRFIKTEEVE